MISVFKTNVQEVAAVERLAPFLDKHLKNAVWNFDLEDSDKILRIESSSEVSALTVQLLAAHGFWCEELEE